MSDVGSEATMNEFDVSGMTCEHCVRAVTEEVSALPGVTDVRITLVPGGNSTVHVTSTSPSTGPRSPPPWTRRGTSWRSDPVSDRVELLIGGMTCASCANRVEKKLNRMPGVEASVNYATEKAHVLLPVGTAVEAAIEVVEATGYTATVPTPSLSANPWSPKGIRRRRSCGAGSWSPPRWGCPSCCSRWSPPCSSPTGSGWPSP